MGATHPHTFQLLHTLVTRETPDAHVMAHPSHRPLLSQVRAEMHTSPRIPRLSPRPHPRAHATRWGGVGACAYTDEGVSHSLWQWSPRATQTQRRPVAGVA